MKKEELIEYFENAELPKTMSFPGATINNCRAFVDTQITRMKEGVPVIQQCSYNALLKLKETIEKSPA